LLKFVISYKIYRIFNQIGEGGGAVIEGGEARKRGTRILMLFF